MYRRSCVQAFLFSLLFLSPARALFFHRAPKLSPDELNDGLTENMFEVLVDVRSKEEWEEGHIENATFVEDLASTGDASLLEGCKYCTMAVYCRSGNRAKKAIRKLRRAGFAGVLYNGQGVNQWTDAGYDLVTTESAVADCSCSKDEWNVCSDSDKCKTRIGSSSGFTMQKDGLLGLFCYDRCVSDSRVGKKKKNGWACGKCT